MLTYQDLLKVPQNDLDRANFTRKVINEYKSGNGYRIAKIADEYDRCQNTTITNYQKTVRTLTGRMIPDLYSANHKSASNFYNIFLTQLASYLLGNGAEWNNKDTAEKLGKDFDNRLYDAGKAALRDGVSYGFWNLDRLLVFSALEFAPIFDEEDGAMKAGVRFWQVDTSKPLRATLYEMDGYTDFLWSKNTVPEAPWQKIEDEAYMRPKRTYILRYRESEADGTEIIDRENYPGFPIVPLWGNPHKQSELVGLREKIDAYDLILNGFENDLDNAQIFWIIRGAGGMDDIDLAQFLDRIRLTGAAAPADGQEVEAREINIPYEARERLLDRLEKQLYKDAMILNPEDIASGAATATQIRAAYEPQNVKADQFEYCVIDFLQSILQLAGIEDEPTFSRSTIVNRQEEIQTLVQAASYLSEEYITRKILNILGDGDQADDIIKQLDADAEERLTVEDEDVGPEDQE